MDESRKQFEEIYDQMKHDRFGSNEDWAWKFWQASRAAIEIELPKPASMLTRLDFNSTYHSVNAIKAECVEKAIRATGIKVKE